MISQLRKKLRACKECPLWSEIFTLPSIGVGSISPDIMFILSGVDREALIFEKPFNEISEKVLLTCLGKAGIAKEKCYVTSLIKCGGLKDKKEYIRTCSNWLIEEIKELQPKCLFFLGEKGYEIFNKTHGDIGIMTYIEKSTLNGIFNRSSLMPQFIKRLELASEFCKGQQKG